MIVIPIRAWGLVIGKLETQPSQVLEAFEFVLFPLISRVHAVAPTVLGWSTPGSFITEGFNRVKAGGLDCGIHAEE